MGLESGEGRVWGLCPLPRKTTLKLLKTSRRNVFIFIWRRTASQTDDLA